MVCLPTYTYVRKTYIPLKNCFFAFSEQIDFSVAYWISQYSNVSNFWFIILKDVALNSIGLNFYPWRCRFQTFTHGIDMAIPRAEVQNSEFHCPFGLICQKSQKGIWNSDFRTSALGIAISNDRSLGPKCSVIKLSVSDNLFFYDISKLSNVFG